MIFNCKQGQPKPKQNVTFWNIIFITYIQFQYFIHLNKHEQSYLFPSDQKNCNERSKPCRFLICIWQLQMLMYLLSYNLLHSILVETFNPICWRSRLKLMLTFRLSHEVSNCLAFFTPPFDYYYPCLTSVVGKKTLLISAYIVQSPKKQHSEPGKARIYRVIYSNLLNTRNAFDWNDNAAEKVATFKTVFLKL